jgi:hypothetical protein
MWQQTTSDDSMYRKPDDKHVPVGDKLDLLSACVIQQFLWFGPFFSATC